MFTVMATDAFGKTENGVSLWNSITVNTLAEADVWFNVWVRNSTPQRRQVLCIFNDDQVTKVRFL